MLFYWSTIYRYVNYVMDIFTFFMLRLHLEMYLTLFIMPAFTLGYEYTIHTHTHTFFVITSVL